MKSIDSANHTVCQDAYPNVVGIWDPFVKCIIGVYGNKCGKPGTHMKSLFYCRGYHDLLCPYKAETSG